MSKPPITEAEETRRGELIIQTLNLKPVGRHHPDWGLCPKRYLTQWGTKTPLGLFRMVERLVKDGE